MKEIWKDIAGYEGIYQVSNLGNVKSIRKNILLKPFNTGMYRNYKTLSLNKNGKKQHYKVHRLVAKAFIPNPNNLPQVNHKDENPNNNCMDNLEWCSAKYNANYGTAIKRRVEKRNKKIKCVETGKIYKSVAKAEKDTKIPNSNISKCANGKLKTCGGYHWQYV